MRYPYVAYDPPAPVVNLLLRDPDTGDSLSWPAQVDTAADRTVLPTRVVRALDSPISGWGEFAGFSGARVELSLHEVEIVLGGHGPFLVEVIHAPAEDNILLGRDILNRLRITLDGPGPFLEIS